jgi:choline dehydrogenase-like flavoprotein
VVARRLAENAAVSVLLLEAGGTDDVPEVMMADQWPMNLGTERDWNFHAESTPYVKWAFRTSGDGKGPGRRIEHQRDGLGART